MIRKTLGLLAGVIMLAGVAHADGSKIAVTDLTYEEKVSQYFHVVSASNKSSVRASESHHVRDGALSSSENGRNNFSGKSENHYFEAEGNYSYVDRGELRKFTADIKGEMLKSGLYRITEGKPYTAKNTEKIYDIIDRIKKGMYPHADYVLFGSVSSIQWRNEGNPISGTDRFTQTLSLELVADFNLINTKTYEVKAAFSATGEGQDVKILTGNNVVSMNRGKVVSEVSKSLGADVAHQLEEQFDPNIKKGKKVTTTTTIEKQEEVIILK